LLLNSEHSGVPEDSKLPTFPSVGLHPHTWPKWGCNILAALLNPHLFMDTFYLFSIAFTTHTPSLRSFFAIHTLPFFLYCTPSLSFSLIHPPLSLSLLHTHTLENFVFKGEKPQNKTKADLTFVLLWWC
jgi:hypothetical protein